MPSVTATRLLVAGLAGTTLVTGKPMGSKHFNTTASINPKKLTGKPEHLASGMIYGIPDQPNQIPDHFYTDIAFRFGRAGGAQLNAPARGWIWGQSEYEARLNSTLSNYETCRKYGAEFQILPHDIWGTDRTNASSVWPGDNGDWTDYDLFLDTLLQDLKTRDAVDGTYFEIWNEPDLPNIFWQRSQQQWLDLYIRTHKRIRSDPALDAMRIDGPSFAYQPDPTSTWYRNWMSAIAGNDTIPDQYVLHLLGGRLSPVNDLQNAQPTFLSLLAEYGLPERQINVNEYATTIEQRPAGAAWWISRLERYNAIGLRANWLSGTTLHDLMANLLTKENDPQDYLATDYVPTGEYQVYKYYVQNMTGERVATQGSKDRFFDVYATLDGDQLKVLAGSRVEAGEWRIEIPVSSRKAKGEVDVKRWSFPGVTQFSVLHEPVDEGWEKVKYKGGKLVLDVRTDNTTAHAFEFRLP